jgi:hypothetical protein
MMNVIVLSVTFYYYYAECRQAECRYAECRMQSVVAPLIHQLYMDIYELYLSSLLRGQQIYQFPFEH